MKLVMWRDPGRLSWTGTSREVMPRGATRRKTQRISLCKEMKTLSCSLLVPKGSPTYCPH